MKFDRQAPIPQPPDQTQKERVSGSIPSPALKARAGRREKHCDMQSSRPLLTFDYPLQQKSYNSCPSSFSTSYTAHQHPETQTSQQQSRKTKQSSTIPSIAQLFQPSNALNCFSLPPPHHLCYVELPQVALMEAHHFSPAQLIALQLIGLYLRSCCPCSALMVEAELKSNKIQS